MRGATLQAIWIAALACAAAGRLAAQEGTLLPQRNDGVGARLVNAPTPFTNGRGNLEAIVNFRLAETVQDGDVHDLWGIDSGADVGLGLSLGVSDRLDLELYRSSVLETYELAVKAELLREGARRPLGLGLRLGADLVQADRAEDPDRPFAQALASLRLGRGVRLFAAPSYATGTPRLEHVFNVPVGLSLPFVWRTQVKLEYVPENDDLPDGEAAWHVAWSKAAGPYLWEIAFGNSRATTVDEYLGGDFVGGFEPDDVRMGFHIVRYFDL